MLNISISSLLKLCTGELHMINILLENKLTISLDKPMSIEDAKKFIPAFLYQDSILAKFNNQVVDFFFLITEDGEIAFLDIQHSDILPVLRHDTAHIMAEAVQLLFPNVQIAIGPSIKDGFYYDFFTENPFKISDLELIESKMYEIVKRNAKFTKKIISKEQAIRIFEQKKEKFKLEIISDLNADEPISIYSQGEFFDLCRGPHLISTGYVKYFKLTKIAASYWRGDSKNVSLQRIYGTSWSSKMDLEKYILQMQEAEKRDHRVIGKSLSLFHFQNEAQGIAFWHHKGYIIYSLLQTYMRNKLQKYSYIEVKTPTLVDLTLWEQSGHWEKFKEHMFTLEDNKKQYALKPMNCPCHIQIFNQGSKSYKDLPIRMSEFGSCYRMEDSGALHGLLRVRNFVQDDAHIFCTEEQINSETIGFYKLLKEIYHDFGFYDISVKFSDRPEIRAGTDKIWDFAEQSLKNAILALNIEYTLNAGEGAFYGPKLEFVLKDAIGREWQCGTLQIDFILAKRLNAHYIDSNGNKQNPIIIHRAVLGTFERFIGILIEQYSGAMPLWLSPIQVSVLTITNKQDQYAKTIFKKLKNDYIRAEMDLDSNKITYKLRRALLQKIPIIIILGKREEENQNIAVRFLGKGNDTKNMKIEELIQFIKKNIVKYIRSE